MKTYVATTGLLFAAVTVAHIWRVIEEGPRMAHEPVFLVLTAASVALTVWAWRLLRTGRSG